MESVEKNRARAKRYRLAHPEKIVETKRAYRERHRKELRASSHAYYLKNRNEIRNKCRERDRKAYVQNREKIVALAIAWGRRNPEKIRAWGKRYRRSHPEAVRWNERTRRAREMGAIGFHSHSKWLQRVNFYGWQCFYCGTPVTAKTVTQDHRIALSKGGTNWASNLVPACALCNCKKGVRKHFSGKKPPLVPSGG